VAREVFDVIAATIRRRNRCSFIARAGCAMANISATNGKHALIAYEICPQAVCLSQMRCCFAVPPGREAILATFSIFTRACSKRRWQSSMKQWWWFADSSASRSKPRPTTCSAHNSTQTGDFDHRRSDLP